MPYPDETSTAKEGTDVAVEHGVVPAASTVGEERRDDASLRTDTTSQKLVRAHKLGPMAEDVDVDSTTPCAPRQLSTVPMEPSREEGEPDGKAVAVERDPRLDPMAHSFPWAQSLIPWNLRSVVPEAALRVSPDRKLHMLPFKVWVRHTVIGAELDNGPSRVWLTENPLSSNDFVLDPERVAKSSLCWHRFLRGAFVRQLMSNVGVVTSSVLAMYIAMLSFFYSVNVELRSSGSVVAAPNFEFEDIRTLTQGIMSAVAVCYPVVTTWCIMSISWEQSMRKEIFYVLLHYKILVDLENESWTPGRRFARSPLTSFFFYWTVLGGLLLTVWAFFKGSALSTVSVILLSTFPIFSWWLGTVTPEWSTVPLAKFLEMKRDAGEGMDIETAVDYLKGCVTVPEASLMAIAAHLPSSTCYTAVFNCCPLPYHVYDSCVAARGETAIGPDPVPDLIANLREQGRLWWRQRAAYEPSTRWPVDPGVRKGCCSCGKGDSYARSVWGGILMRRVLPFSDDLFEIRHLVRQYNCWCGSSWLLVMWILYGMEMWLAYAFVTGNTTIIGRAGAATGLPPTTPPPP